MSSYAEAVAKFNRISHRTRVRAVRASRRRRHPQADVTTVMHLTGTMVAPVGQYAVDTGIPVPGKEELKYSLVVNWKAYPVIAHAEEFVARVWRDRPPAPTLSEAFDLAAAGFAALPPAEKMRFLAGCARPRCDYPGSGVRE